MIINSNTQKLKKIIDDFYRVTGLNMSVLDPDFNPIVIVPQQHRKFCRIIKQYFGELKCTVSDSEILVRCRESKKPEMHICHAGLIDIALPIIAGSEIIGYIIMGQLRTAESFKSLVCRFDVPKSAQDILAREYESLACYDTEKAQSAANLASMAAAYILLENMIISKHNEVTESACKYINKNLCGDLSLKTLCAALHVSKNTLYKNFGDCFGCTVGQYILDRRIEYAKQLLKNSSMPVSLVCEKCGIGNYTYFCRVFKQKTSFAPLTFRRQG